jgi:hypothetical protein
MIKKITKKILYMEYGISMSLKEFTPYSYPIRREVITD